MEKETNTKIKCPHCGTMLDLAISVSEEISPIPPSDNRMSSEDILKIFNPILKTHGYNTVEDGMKVKDYINWSYDLAQRYYDNDEWMFKEDTYHLIYNYRGTDTSNYEIAYNGMQAWLIASILAELVPDFGDDNTQTNLFATAYSIGGDCSYPLYNDKAFKADPYAMREVASIMYAICRGDAFMSSNIYVYREELGGSMIPASNWEELGFVDKELSDEGGRIGYVVKSIGYLVNTDKFIPSAPGPRVPDTNAYKRPLPIKEGQPKVLFNDVTENYIIDEHIDDEVVNNYNCGAQTPLEVWENYSIERKNRIIEALAVTRCTFNYMFSNRKYLELILDNGNLPIVDGYNRFCFKVVKNSPLYLEGVFSNLYGMYRYNISQENKNSRELFLDSSFKIADNFRFTTYDPNWGRKRPGGGMTRTGSARSVINGSPLNELYNIDISCIVADTEEQREKWAAEDGFATERPASYPSGHSAQIWLGALLFTQMNNKGNCKEWISRAFDYSIDRTIDRAHWNSDCIYGRLFGAISLPIILAMSGLKEGYDATKEFVLNPEPEVKGDWSANIIVKNLTNENIDTTGEIRLYVDNHIGINIYLPGAKPDAGALYTFGVGENDYIDMNIHCQGNGFNIDDSYNEAPITDCRFYDSRHWNSTDCGFKVTLDTEDPRCSSVILKAGATYVLKIEYL